MAAPISVYLSDETLRKLDALVEQQASIDRACGLEGRQVTSRSKMVAQLVDGEYGRHNSLSIGEIRYAVVSLAEEYGAGKVSLFGSYARGDQTPTSDVDILLEKGNIKGMQVLDFQEDLAEALGRSVDVVTTAGASPRFLAKVAKDSITLFDSAA